MSYTGTHERTLNHIEMKLARSVFEKSLPAHDKMLITNGIGAGNRPWTERVSPVRSFWGAGSASGGHWRMHLGPDGYRSTGNMQDTLIHELVHIWQGHNNWLGGSYMLYSAVAQTIGGGYEVSNLDGKVWGDFNVEQKAHLVEGWFKDGMKVHDLRYVFINNHIRRGKD